MPAFGFSVGDFIVAIELISKVSKALKDVGGASTEYQQVIIELEGLKNALRHLAALKPSEDNINHVNAIRGMALACQLPLRDFLARLQRYERTMGPLVRRRPFIGAGQKIGWTFFVMEEVTKLRAFLAAKVMSINLLLATHASETLSNLSARTSEQHDALHSAISQHRTILEESKDELGRVKEEVVQSRTLLSHEISQQSVMSQALDAEVKSLRQDVQRNKDQLGALSDTTTSLQSSVISLTSIKEQAWSFIRSFPAEVRGLLQKIVQSNMQIYGLLLSLQGNVPGSPTLLLQTNIQFEDALGRVRQLPYEWFKHWEPFRGLLLAEFKNIPGENHVLNGQFHIVDLKRPSCSINETNWSQSVFPGLAISMSVILSQLRMQAGTCPRESCKAKQTASSSSPAMVTCPNCGLQYFPTSSLEEGFGRITVCEEDEEILRRQIDQDLKQYGSRILPFEVKEMGDTFTDSALVKEASTSRKRSAPDSFLESGEHYPRAQKRLASEVRPAMAFHVHPGTEETPISFGIDWSQGESPLDAWLNQSAVPASEISDSQQEVEDRVQEKEIREREMKEIEHFRHVHISHASRSEAGASGAERASATDLHELGASGLIYYRNILDRYPDAQDYLARRLAKANCRRAAKLQSTWKQNKAEAEAEADMATQRHEDPPAGPAPRVPEPDNVEEELALALLIAEISSSHSIVRTLSKNITLTYRDRLAKLLSRGGHYQGPVPMPKEDTLQVEISRLLEGTQSSLAYAETIQDIELTAQIPVLLPRTSLGEPLAAVTRPQQDISESTVINLINKVTSSIASAQSLHTAMVLITEGQGPNAELKRIRYLIKSLNSIQFHARRIRDVIFARSIRNGKNTRIKEPPPPRPLSTSQGAQQGASENFWFPKRGRRRPGSPASRCSSRNQSLRGRSRYDSEEQNPVFSPCGSPRSLQSGSQASIELNPILHLPRPPVEWGNDASSPAQKFWVALSPTLDLPRPPVECGNDALSLPLQNVLPKLLEFECDLCGKSVQVRRRRDWKKHVFQDLQPYVCTFEDCVEADTMYCTRRELVKHELTHHRAWQPHTYRCKLPNCEAEFMSFARIFEHVDAHFDRSAIGFRGVPCPRDSMKLERHELLNGICPLCQQVIEPGLLMLGRHLGRHMEEISFAVVMKPYEEWKFYDDTVSRVSSNRDVVS